jgi:hypothetical protein
MSLPMTTPPVETVWDLPPLILHPFNERVSPSSLLENSRAALMLSGLIPNDGSDIEELQRRILAGRFGEVRMLFFLGKDVFRWIDQCVGWASRVPGLNSANIGRQSFAGLLTASTPPGVKEKLSAWGVADHVSIFSRAIGLNGMFSEPPEFRHLSEEFLRNYHRYADALYRCYMETDPHDAITPAKVRFTLYASGEYSRVLAAKWATE